MIDPQAENFDDQAEIRRLIENWAIWRDSGEFDRFLELWHADGWMVATWFQASAAEFTARARRAFEQGSTSMHVLGGTSVDVRGSRAVAQTRMQILQRTTVHDVEVDVACHGRFYDFLQKTNDGWKLVLRQPIYELDRLAPTEPGAQLKLDPELLKAFPAGYRHLAYVQSQSGFDVKRDMPGTRGPATDALFARGRQWLDGVEHLDLRSPLLPS